MKTFLLSDAICSRGRTKKQLDSQGIGSGLYLQMESSPVKTEKVPFFESNLDPTVWSKGKCAYTMGMYIFETQSACHGLERANAKTKLV